MKTIIKLSLSIMALGLLSSASNVTHHKVDEAEGIQFFEGSWEEALKESQETGKPIFLDAYASWCGPCRRENPNVVNAYKKYRKAKFKSADGFTIASVSLDRKQESWEKAVKQDQLDWDWHGSDLAGWDSEAAALYGVSSIPMSFLVDENGIIVAKNLRGMELHIQIDKHVARL